jgi:hypothetical protein
LVVAFFRTCLVAAQPTIRHQLLTLKKTRPSIPEKYAEGLNPILRTLKNLLSVFGIEVSIVITGQIDPYGIMPVREFVCVAFQD